MLKSRSNYSVRKNEEEKSFKEPLKESASQINQDITAPSTKAFRIKSNIINRGNLLDRKKSETDKIKMNNDQEAESMVSEYQISQNPYSSSQSQLHRPFNPSSSDKTFRVGNSSRPGTSCKMMTSFYGLSTYHKSRVQTSSNQHRS